MCPRPAGHHEWHTITPTLGEKLAANTRGREIDDESYDYIHTYPPTVSEISIKQRLLYMIVVINKWSPCHVHYVLYSTRAIVLVQNVYC